MIKLDKVTKIYYNNGVIATGFSKVSLELEIGEFVVIVGESGSGKSTLLNVISGLDTYEEGEMYINGKETSHYSEDDMQEYRRKYISNIFQAFNLINGYTVRQNVELALIINGRNVRKSKAKIDEILKRTGLWDLRNRRASKLSGGQKQRVAIARALVQETPIIICDEPTGNLDSESAKEIFELLRDVSKDKLVVLVTHNYDQVKDYATRVIRMRDGSVSEDIRVKNAQEVENVKEAEYTKMSLKESTKIAMMNVGSTPVKGMLAMIVFLIMGLVILFITASAIKTMNDQYAGNFDEWYFSYTDPKRIVLAKKDKTAFSDSELDEIKNINHVEKVTTNEEIIDKTVVFDYEIGEDNYYSFQFFARKRSDLKETKVTVGRLPEKENELLVYGNYFEFTDKLKKGPIDLALNNYYSSIYQNFKIVGFIKDIYYDLETPLVYVDDSRYNVVLSNNYYDYDILVEGREANGLRGFVLNANVPEGEVWVPAGQIRDDLYNEIENLMNKKLTVHRKNQFYTKDKDLIITKVVDDKNVNDMLKGFITGEEAFYFYRISAYINPNDFAEFINSPGIYQMSIFADSVDEVNNIVNELKSKDNYVAIGIKDSLDNDTLTLYIMRVMFYGALIVLVGVCSLISYILIKFLLKSRVSYYAVIRMLGGNVSTNKALVRIELLFYAIVAYIWMLVIWEFAVPQARIYSGSIFLKWKLYQYITCFIGILAMSLLVSNRFSKSVFKESMVTTYNMEV